MRALTFPDSFPDSLQENFLKAALCSGETAAESLAKWKTKGTIKPNDYPTYKLAPLLYDNLVHNKIQDSILPDLVETKKFFEIKNARLIRATSRVIGEMRKKDIPVILLKGIPLILLAYPSWPGRGMTDVDLMVPLRNVVEAITLMIELNWVPFDQNLLEPEGKWSRRFLSQNKACSFFNEDGCEIDLHWHAMANLVHFEEEDTQNLWEACIPLKVGEATCASLCPEDMFIHVCVHGAVWKKKSLFRWVPDAVMVLRHWPDLNWERVKSQAVKFHLVIPIRMALRYLKARFNMSIPDDVIRDLEKAPIAKHELREYDIYANAPKNQFFDPFPFLWFRYKRMMEINPSHYKRLGFYKYLQDQIGLDYPWELPLYLFLKPFKKLFRERSP